MGGLPQLPRTWLLSFPPATRVTQLSLLCRVCQRLVPCLGVFAAFWLARWLGGFTTLLSQHLPSGWDPQGTAHRSFPFLPLCMASPQIIWVPEVIPGCLLMPSPAALGLQLQRCIFHQCSGRSPPADPTLHFLLVPRTHAPSPAHPHTWGRGSQRHSVWAEKPQSSTRSGQGDSSKLRWTKKKAGSIFFPIQSGKKQFTLHASTQSPQVYSPLVDVSLEMRDHISHPDERLQNPALGSGKKRRHLSSQMCESTWQSAQGNGGCPHEF